MDGKQCVHIASTHPPQGHQNDRGKIIASGAYTSTFTSEIFYPEWKKRIRHCISSLQRNLQRELDDGSGKISEEICFLPLHSQEMQRHYQLFDTPDDLINHATCLCCLMRTPIHPLPCGHVLCSHCIRSYSSSSNEKNILRMDNCPLHPTTGDWSPAHLVRSKPEGAGVRLLALDG